MGKVWGKVEWARSGVSERERGKGKEREWGISRGMGELTVTMVN